MQKNEVELFSEDLTKRMQQLHPPPPHTHTHLQHLLITFLHVQVIIEGDDYDLEHHCYCNVTLIIDLYRGCAIIYLFI